MSYESQQNQLVTNLRSKNEITTAQNGDYWVSTTVLIHKETLVAATLVIQKYFKFKDQKLRLLFNFNFNSANLWID